MSMNSDGASARHSNTEQTRRKYPRVIEHDEVACRQVVNKPGKSRVVHQERPTIQHEKPEPPRSSGGSCATSSSGRSKSKSETFIVRRSSRLPA